MPASPAGSLGLMGYNFGGQQPPAQQAAPTQGNDQGLKEPDQKKFDELSGKAREVGDTLGNKLQARWEEWLLSRRFIEEDWLKYVRAYNGVYEPHILQNLHPDQSHVFVQLTRMKTDTAYNRLSDLLFGPEMHWDIGPSPLPELSEERKQQLRLEIEEGMALNPMMMGEEPPLDEEIEKVEQDIVRKASKFMKMKIKDQLEKNHYEEKARSCIFEMCVIGTGVMKGPQVSVDYKPKWARTSDGDWDVMDEEDIVPRLDAPSLFDMYPDPYATKTSDGLGMFERHVMRKNDLDSLINQPYFLQDKVEALIEQYPSGNHWDTYTDIELRFVSGQSVTGEPELRYDVLEYWGWVDGQDLIASGMDASKIDINKSYYCNVWNSGGITIKATISPSKPTKQMYSLITYKKVLASQYGVGVPFLMKDSQETVNAAARELINNAALSSGPQVEVAIDLIELDANEDIRVIVPWRVWPRVGGDLSYPAVRFTNVPDTTESMAKVIQIWRAFADEETNIPSYTHGSTAMGGAAGKTASGMSMLMGAASMDIKGVVKNWDEFVKRFIEKFYHFNMQWSDDEKIKGDMEPEAKGSSALLAKEIKSQRVVMFLQMTNNPVDNAIMGPERRARLLRSGAEAMDIDPDDAAPDPDEEMPMGDMNVPGMGMNVPGMMPEQQGGPTGAGGGPPGTKPKPAGSLNQAGEAAPPGGVGMDMGPPIAASGGQ